MAGLIRPVATALLLIALAANAGPAIYLTAKAHLAQHLLSRAWAKSDARQSPVKPWPWADIVPRGRLLIPRLAMEQIVLGDHSSEAMAFGPGLVTINDAVVLAGHRDSHFEFLRELRAGDRLQWQALGESPRTFHVSATWVVDTREQQSIVPPPNTLMLITCYPFDALQAGGPLRYVILAEPNRSPDET